NEHDSERMKGMIESIGYEQAEARDDADLILFNTCSIRESADSRFIGNLGEAKRLKTEKPDRVVGVGGCWAQSVKDEVFERFPPVDARTRGQPRPGLAGRRDNPARRRWRVRGHAARSERQLVRPRPSEGRAG